jgi:hypothetical protein
MSSVLAEMVFSSEENSPPEKAGNGTVNRPGSFNDAKNCTLGAPARKVEYS